MATATSRFTSAGATHPSRPVAPNDSGRAAGTYLLLCGLGASLLLPTVHLLISARAASVETADQSVFVAFLLWTAATMLCGAFFYARSPLKIASAAFSPTGRLLAGLALLGILVISAGTITTLAGEEQLLWFGYGKTIAAVAVLALPLPILIFDTDNRNLHRVLACVTYVGASVIYLPSIIQPPWGLIDWMHSIYVLNELLAPQAGGYPWINFHAQYTSILGYVFNLLFASSGTLDQSVWFLTILAVGVICALLLPLWQAYPKNKRYLAVLFTVPAIFIVKAKEDAYSGSIGALFSALPVRLLFPAIIALILVTRRARDASLQTTLVLALTSSIAILNNMESGTVATIAAAMVMTIAGPTGLQMGLALFFGGLVVAFAATDTFIVSAGRFDIGTAITFVTGFGSGIGALPMPTFGLWVFVFVLLSLAATISTLRFRMVHCRAAPAMTDESRQLAVIALFWGAFGLGMSPYYINRSVVSGQLQFLLIPAFLAGAALLPLVLSESRARRDIVLLIAALPCALSIASTIDHPSLSLALGRLRSDHPSLGQIYAPEIPVINDRIARIRARHPDARVALYTSFGFIMGSATHLRSYLPLNALTDLAIVPPSIGMHMCEELAADGNRFLVNDWPLDESSTRMIRTCGYAPTDEFGTEPAQITVLQRR